MSCHVTSTWRSFPLLCEDSPLALYNAPFTPIWLLHSTDHNHDHPIFQVFDGNAIGFGSTTTSQHHHHYHHNNFHHRNPLGPPYSSLPLPPLLFEYMLRGLIEPFCLFSIFPASRIAIQSPGSPCRKTTCQNRGNENRPRLTKMHVWFIVTCAVLSSIRIKRKALYNARFLNWR